MIQAVNTKAAATRFARLSVLGLVAMSAMLGGCRGDRSDSPPHQFFPDMDDQPKLKAQSETGFFEDGHSQREPVEGTVAFGSNALIPSGEGQWVDMYAKDRDDMLKADPTYYFGLVAGSDNTYVKRMPVEVTPELIKRGKERFNIYCSMCHGYDAMGGDSGTVGRLMNVRPVNLLDEKYRDRNADFGTDGYIYHIIRQGLWSPDGTNRMPAYGSSINEQDSWAVVAYIRTLQKAFDAKGRRIGAVDQPERMPDFTTDNKKGEQQIASSKNGGEG